jgi:hypothetical protein
MEGGSDFYFTTSPFHHFTKPTSSPGSPNTLSTFGGMQRLKHHLQRGDRS